MKNIPLEYEFDPYGDNPRNFIKDEVHIIAPANGTDFNFIVPRKGLFHRRSFRLLNLTTGKPLVAGRDFYFGFAFDKIILSGSQQPVYGAIVLNDRRISAKVSIQYQCLGAEYVPMEQEYKELVANRLIDPRIVPWSSVVDVPDELPPIPHREHSDKFVGMDDVVIAIDGITAQMRTNFGKCYSMIMEHLNDHNNPHRLTLKDLGLDELGAMVLATKEEAEGGTDNLAYMSSLRVAQYCAANILPVIKKHEDRTDNPHKVTAEQVGLDKVQNYPISTTEQAQTGRNNSTYMTPLRTKEAIDVFAKVILETHSLDKNNPHGVNAKDVGLGDVPNCPMATLEEALEGLRNDRFISPYLLHQILAGFDGGTGSDSEHPKRTDNPHKVTAKQVGLGDVPNYPAATPEEGVEGVRNDRLMTPMTTKILSDYLIGQYALRRDNPNGVTAEQVGLGKVGNYPIATREIALMMNSRVDYLAPFHLNDYTETIIKPLITEMIGTPEDVTKESIGLGNVENYKPGELTDIEVPGGGEKTYTTSDVVAKALENMILDGAFIVDHTPEDRLISGEYIPTIFLESSLDYEPYGGAIFTGNQIDFGQISVYPYFLEAITEMMGAWDKIHEINFTVPFKDNTAQSTGIILGKVDGNLYGVNVTVANGNLTLEHLIYSWSEENRQYTEESRTSVAMTKVPEIKESSVRLNVKIDGTKYTVDLMNYDVKLEGVFTDVVIPSTLVPQQGLFFIDKDTSTLTLHKYRGLEMTVPVLGYGKATLSDNQWVLEAGDIPFLYRRGRMMYSTIDDKWYGVIKGNRVIELKGGTDLVSSKDVLVVKEGSQTALKLTGHIGNNADVEGDVAFIVP